MIQAKDYDFRNKRVFLSGPMTGIEDWNRAAFDEVNQAVIEAGAIETFNPAVYCPSNIIPKHPHEHYMLQTLHRLTAHSSPMKITSDEDNKPHYDCIVLLPGWQYSGGSFDERLVARSIGIECVEWGEGL